MLHKISTAVPRKDSGPKASGSIKYISDYTAGDMYYMAVKSADVQHAVIKSVSLPEIPEGYVLVDKTSFPGMNRATIVAEDWPFFAEDEILYYGQPILAIAGPDLSVCERLCAGVRIDYAEKSAVSLLDEADEYFNDYNIVKGNPDAAFDAAAEIFVNSYRTGMQEQAYMEPQGMAADFRNGVLTVRGSLQCPYYIRNALMKAFNLDSDSVRVIQFTTGGAFGGKEDYPTILAGQAAAAAVLSGHPVKIVLDRRNDMSVTPKRHPSLIDIRTAVDSAGRITGMDIDCKLDAGAYQSLSGVVLERAIFICTGAYNIPNVRVRGRTMKTNHIPSGAFRGFGGPQALFAADMNMYYLARSLDREPLDFRLEYLYRQNDHSVTGGTFRDPIKFDEIIEKIESVSGYSRKWKEFDAGLQTDKPGQYRGIGISFAAHGGAFTGSGEQDIIKSVVRLRFERPAEVKNGGSIRILVSNVEMGQGASVTLRKIVAEAAGFPFERVIFTDPDTAEVPDSGPTVASRTVMIVGKLLHDAALDLRDRLAGFSGESFTVEKRYVHPEEFVWNEETFSGDAYPGYSWSANVIEVEVDRLTFEINVTGSWAVYDVGTPIDIKILKGQMQGGTTQSLGYSSIEKMQMMNGRPAQASFTDYTIPTCLDFPDTECHFIDNPYRYGPFGAKAAGELPNEGPAAAFAAAVSQAVNRIQTEIPILPENLEAAIERSNN